MTRTLCICYCLHAIYLHNGYRNKTHPVPTSTLARAMANNPGRHGTTDEAVRQRYGAQAAGVAAWWAKYTPQPGNEFEHYCKKATSEDEGLAWGYLAAATVKAVRAMAQAGGPAYVGAVGERVRGCVLRVEGWHSTGTREFNGRAVERGVYRMATAGGAWVAYFTAARLPMGREIMADFTVTAHSTWQGKPQTVVANLRVNKGNPKKSE